MDLIFENSNFIIINKPNNLAVHGGSNISFNLIEALRNSYKFKNTYLELCHRLDKDTSGCLILAKNHVFLKKFHLLLKNNKISKVYHAFVKGNFKCISRSCFNTFILNNYNVKIKKQDKITINYYSLINKYKDYSLLEITPVSGKMHQIRIHLSYLGHPIIGDLKYGSKKLNLCLSNYPFFRMFLHLKSIKFKCPIENRSYFFKTDYDKNFLNFINFLSR